MKAQQVLFDETLKGSMRAALGICHCQSHQGDELLGGGELNLEGKQTLLMCYGDRFALKPLAFSFNESRQERLQFCTKIN